MQLLFVLAVLHAPLTGVDGVYECITGMWGAQCTKTCGHCEGGEEFCHVYDGYCVNGCAGGYKGTYCKETCEPGTYGQYCRRNCGKCSQERPVCDRETGKCLVACQPGFQMPYCTTPCPFNSWGANCDEQCQCQNTTASSCGCHHETGACLTCQKNTVLRYYPVSSAPKCLEEHKLFGKTEAYVPPSVLNFPYKPILALGSTVAMFVFGNFLWWWFVVRSPEPKEPPPEIKRAKKPPKRKAAKMARYKKNLSEFSKKIPSEQRRKSSRRVTDAVAPDM